MEETIGASKPAFVLIAFGCLNNRAWVNCILMLVAMQQKFAAVFDGLVKP